MPKALCNACGVVSDYHNRRGNRLKEMSCPECGAPGRMSAVVYDYDRKCYIRPKGNRTTGTKRVACALCGRKHMYPGRRVARIATPVKTFYFGNELAGKDPNVELRPGDYVCAHVHGDNAIAAAIEKREEASHGNND